MNARRRLRVVFRVAAGPRLGFGHVMRIRALAEALGVRPMVSLRGGPAARAAVERTGCRLVSLTTNPLDEVDLLVVDDPSAREAATWVRRARRRGVPTVGIQDAGAADCGADLVIDGGFTGRQTDGRRRLVGSRFCLLNAAHIGSCERQTRHGQRVLIALGGGGHVRSLARRLASAVARRCPTAEIVVAPGFVSRPPPRLRHGRWISSPRGLTTALRSASVAVVAGGHTLCEACALGTPVVGLAVVHAQRPAIEACSAANALVDAGGPHISARTARRAANGVARLLEDAAFRQRTAARARTLVDGRGAERVAKRITRLLKRQVGRV